MKFRKQFWQVFGKFIIFLMNQMKQLKKRIYIEKQDIGEMKVHTLFKSKHHLMIDIRIYSIDFKQIEDCQIFRHLLKYVEAENTKNMTKVCRNRKKHLGSIHYSVISRAYQVSATLVFVLFFRLCKSVTTKGQSRNSETKILKKQCKLIYKNKYLWYFF